jgi:hypothetical protein
VFIIKCFQKKDPPGGQSEGEPVFGACCEFAKALCCLYLRCSCGVRELGGIGGRLVIGGLLAKGR